MRTNEGIALVFLVVMAGLVIGAALFYRFKRRELDYKERMAALEKGAALPVLDDPAHGWRPRAYLLRGLVWLFVGLSMMIFIGGVALTQDRREPAWARVEQAQRAKEKGATEEQIQAIMNEHRRDGMNVAVALIGLIPAGVGLAYLLTYRIENRNP